MSWRRSKPTTTAIQFQDGVQLAQTQETEARFASLHSEIETLRQQASNNLLIKEQNAKLNDVLAQNDLRKEMNARLESVEQQLVTRLGTQLDILENRFMSLKPSEDSKIVSQLHSKLDQLEKKITTSLASRTSKTNSAMEQDVVDRLESLSSRIQKINLDQKTFTQTELTPPVITGTPERWVEEKVRMHKLQNKLSELRNLKSEYI